jgi:hypothetical protein
LPETLSTEWRTRLFSAGLGLFPLHRFTELKLDLFSTKYTDCPKSVGEGGGFLWGREQKGPMTGPRSMEGRFHLRGKEAFAKISR